MKYELYSEIPDCDKELMTGGRIKNYACTYSAEVYWIKDNKCDHRVYHPNDELEDSKVYIVYEDGYVAGSGVCYNKIFIFE